MSYHIKRKDNIPFESQQLEAILFEGFNGDVAKKGMKPINTFGISLEDDQNTILGGITGAILFGCLYIDMFWVHESLRKQGWGRKLMQEAEKIGKENGCAFATLNTMDWMGTAPFYQKLGYTIEFTNSGYDKNAKMLMLRKSLN